MRLIRPVVTTIVTLGIATGCRDAQIATPVRTKTPALATLAVSGVDNDATMGTMSAVARHIVFALQDSAVRMQVAAAMKADSTTRLGIDLQDCDNGGVAQSIMSAGEKRGATSAVSICNVIKSRGAGVLFMDRDRLHAWDGHTIPIVTAIDNPRAQLPRTFHGYLSSERVIDLPADGSLKGPILVVLPLVHPHHNTFGKQRGTDRIVEVPTPKTPHSSSTFIQPPVVR